MAKEKTTIRVIKSTDKPKKDKKPSKLAKPAKDVKATKAEKPAKTNKPSKLVKFGKGKKQDKAEKKRRPAPKFLRAVAKPFVAIGRYFKLSWIELKQVRWPNRRTTWKLTLMVIVYCILFAAIIMLLDALFQYIFNQALA